MKIWKVQARKPLGQFETIAAYEAATLVDAIKIGNEMTTDEDIIEARIAEIGRSTYTYLTEWLS